MWEYQRSRQDSADDSPDPDGRIARRNFLRADEYNDYLDPGAATCAPLAYLNGGTTIYGTRPDYGYDIANDEYIDGHYCGSKEAIAYGTMISGRKSALAWAICSSYSKSVPARRPRTTTRAPTCLP